MTGPGDTQSTDTDATNPTTVTDGSDGTNATSGSHTASGIDDATALAAASESALAGSTVLVTGGSGFIGSHLVDALAPVADVRVLDRNGHDGPADPPASATVYRGDVTRLTDLDATTEDVDYVFHLAALASVPETLERPTLCLDVNATATAAVLERARRANATVVFASSAAVYGRPESLPVEETEPLAPRSPYGISKAAADRYVRRYGDWFDVDAIPLRFFNVYGPRQRADRGVVPAFVDRARRGEDLVVHGDGTQTRDFVHVSDVVRALVLAATSDATGEPINVATGTSTSISELAAIVADRVDADVDVVHDDPRPADIQHSRAAVERARDRLGFEAAVDLEDGLAALLAPPTDPA